MRLNGYSQKGSYHSQNQDAFCCAAGENGCFALAVSDGLGSKKQSAVGAAAFCRSVNRLFCTENSIPTEEIALTLHRQWLEELGDALPEECSATALFAFWKDGVFTLGALGDGIAAAWMEGGQTLVLLDPKDEHFLNETDCLTAEYRADLWHIRQVQQPPKAVLLCTDGIEIYPGTEQTVSRFIQDMAQSYEGMEAEAVQEDIWKWIGDWPGADDKTIAYYLYDPIARREEG